jgi:hypothetical protein
VDLKTVLAVWLLLPVALVGCRGDEAGGKPGGNDAGMDLRPDVPRPDAICPADAAGGGECPFNFCGQAKVGLPANQYPQSGADSLCGTRTCTVGAELATGDGFQLTCVDPIPGALAFGAPCSRDPAQGMRCAHDSLCVTAPDAAGAFCSQLCRNDADCPATGHCLEYQTAPLTDSRQGSIGMCTPESKIAGTPCVREAQCAPAQGCVVYGGRTSFRICRAGGAKSLGTACTGDGECRSHQCFDRALHVSGGQNRAYCSGVCQVNSDCGPDQMCSRLVVGNNGTPGDPLDDLVVGFCRTLFVPAAATGCATDANCVARQDGSDGCDVTHGLCYKKAAVPGSPCATEADCPAGADCSIGPRFTGGYCQTFGCDPAATTGVNACPGTNSTCAQRGGPDEPISACYEKCSPGGPACSRAAAGYSCEAPTSTSLPSICLVAGGT